MHQFVPFLFPPSLCVHAIKNILHRTDKEYVKAATICAKAYFLVGNNEKSSALLQALLKQQPKNMDALYWQGLLLLFTYKEEQDAKTKYAKAKQAEFCLLGTILRIPQNQNKK